MNKTITPPFLALAIGNAIVAAFTTVDDTMTRANHNKPSRSKREQL